MLNEIKTKEGSTEVNTTKDHLSNVGVGNTGADEDGGTIVEVVVGTGKLLPHLENHTKNETVEHAGSIEHGEEGFVGNLLVFLVLLVNFTELNLQDAVVLRDTIELDHSGLGSLNLAPSVVKARSLREHKNADTEDQAPCESDTKSDPPRTGIITVLSTVVDAVGDENTESDEQLIGTAEGVSYLEHFDNALIVDEL